MTNNTLKLFKPKLFQKLATTLTTATALTCMPVASCYAISFTLKPFVGVDIGGRTLQFEDGYGKNHFAGHYYHASPYIGIQLLEHLGLQIGYETSDKRSNVKIYNTNQQVLGTSQITNPLRFSSTAKINGEFLGISVNTDSVWLQHHIPMDFSLLAGVASLKLKTSHTEFTGNALTVVPAGGAYITENINTPKKICPKIAIAAKFFVSKIDGLAFKIVYGWEKTSNLKEQQITKVITTAAIPNKLMTIQLKNSHYITLGLYYSL